ncbi:MAG TPA: DsbE family thiol:disulfide interchange protein [Gammaproteobacteria bacterium]|nr:DsbE family thiol:disulfide interchange protein [Gammaproteobacteria bacterium]
MWRYAIPVVLLLVLGAFFYRGLYLNPTFVESPLIGKPAPEFTLPDLENPEGTVGTEDIAGRYALLNVWATWCVECRHEHDFLLSLAESGMPIYGLNWKDERDKALEWLEVLGDPYVASAVDEIGDVAIDYGVYGAPETFLIGPDLTILAKHIGPLSTAIWEARFAPLIESHHGAP